MSQGGIVAIRFTLVDLKTGRLLLSDHIFGWHQAGRKPASELYADLAFGTYLYWNSPLGRASEDVINDMLVKVEDIVPTGQERITIIKRIGPRQVRLSRAPIGVLPTNETFLVVRYDENRRRVEYIRDRDTGRPVEARIRSGDANSPTAWLIGLPSRWQPERRRAASEARSDGDGRRGLEPPAAVLAVSTVHLQAVRFDARRLAVVSDSWTTALRVPRRSRILLDDAQADADRVALLLPLVYDQLRAVAERALATERPDHTLQATALVHEAYMRWWGSARCPGRARRTSTSRRPRPCGGSSSTTRAVTDARSAAAIHARVALAEPKKKNYKTLPFSAGRRDLTSAADDGVKIKITKSKVDAAKTSLDEALLKNPVAAAQSLGHVDYKYYVDLYTDWLHKRGDHQGATKKQAALKKVLADRGVKKEVVAECDRRQAQYKAKK